MSEIDVYRQAIDRWGVEIQLIVLMEECAELIKECSKVLREKRLTHGGVSFFTLQTFIEEAVDVQIMVDQMRYGWLDDPIEWNAQKNQKLSKVAQWLKEEE